MDVVVAIGGIRGGESWKESVALVIRITALSTHSFRFLCSFVRTLQEDYVGAQKCEGVVRDARSIGIGVETVDYGCILHG